MEDIENWNYFKKIKLHHYWSTLWIHNTDWLNSKKKHRRSNKRIYWVCFWVQIRSYWILFHGLSLVACEYFPKPKYTFLTDEWSAVKWGQAVKYSWGCTTQSELTELFSIATTSPSQQEKHYFTVPIPFDWDFVFLVKLLRSWCKI